MFFRKSFVTSLFLLTIASSLFSQEIVTGLSFNPVIANQAKKWKQNPQKSNTEPLKIPLFIDFSNYIGYPDQNIFVDRQGFVNNTFAINPPTIGVVTLDAIDENGAIYEHANSTGFFADTLTSNFIRLDSSFSNNRPITIQDSLYFSFYFQPGGGCASYPFVQWERIGNRPESQDMLFLDFGYTQNGEPNWINVWSTSGVNLDDWILNDPNRLTFFKQVLIPIIDAYFLVDSFQFRFRNIASMEDNGVAGWESNVDQWHLDYFRLDINRTIDDIYPNDIAFVAPASSCIEPYQAVPWSHFQSTMMKEKFENKMSNLSNIIRNASYNYYVTKNGSIPIYTYTCNNENIEPYYNSGLQDYSYHATPNVEFTITPDGLDSAIYTITHIHKLDGAIGDNLSSNDTIRFDQIFKNYFAYDDGTAEAGYSIYSLNLNPHNYLAMQFTLQHSDTLRAIKMWFNKTLNDVNVVPFTIMVWAKGTNNEPGTLLYQMDAQTPLFSEDYLNFATYYLDQPVPVSGTFFVGIYQTHNTQINLGYDQNTDARDYFLYKTATTWEQPIVKGTPMIRPYVGAYIEPQNINEAILSGVNIYPNPATTQLNVFIENFGLYSNLLLDIYDIFGKQISKQKIQNELTTIPIDNISEGIYIIKITDSNNRVKTLKFIKQ
jgi:hypothetical protein